MRRAAPVIKTVLGIFSFKADLRSAYVVSDIRYKWKRQVLPRVRAIYTELCSTPAFEVILFKYM
jgi:hypothetical protein